MRKRVFVAAIFAAVLVVGSAVPALAEEPSNPVCLSCHAEPGQTSVTLDFSGTVSLSRCRSCHWVAVHPSHNKTDQCNSCHKTWPARQVFGRDFSSTYSTPFGFFDSPDSLMTDPALIHELHVRGSWPNGYTYGTSSRKWVCGSCHAPAACIACHDSVPHSDHASPTYPPVVRVETTGTASGVKRLDTRKTLSNGCINASCHDVAAFAPQDASTIWENDAPSTQFTGTWARLYSGLSSGGYYAQSNVAGSKITFNFTGPGTAELLVRMTYASGYADISVDGIPQPRVNLYSPVFLEQVPILTVELGEGPHFIEVTATGTHQAGVTDAKVCVDAVRVTGEVAPIKPFKPDCRSCHATAHENDEAAHTANAEAGLGCDVCHDLVTIYEHERTTSGPVSCIGCHSSAEYEAAVKPWDDSCEACHATKHMSQDASHTPLPESETACLGSDCHGGDGDLAGLHSEATTTTAGVTKTSCEVCHWHSVPTEKDCTVCHPDRMAAHGYDPLKHMSNETCLLECHVVELKPVHDAGTPPVTCSGCHATKVDEIRPWDKSCISCHPTAVADHAPASHVGTDTAYQEASFFGNGCTQAPEHTSPGFCHDISSVAVLHSRMPDRGCKACHGAGKTPSTECFDCHKPGSANSYTIPGEASADIPITTYPTSDDSITPGWTWTTAPAGQPIYSVVNSPYPPVNTTRFVTITSNAAGAVLFGWDGVSIPDGAVIRDVRIYAKGKATVGNQRKMQGAFKVGGQTYLSPITASPFLTTAWTATAPGQGMGSPEARNDYTREPLYGETLWQNPKTSEDWTAAELNGTDPDSSLEAFGINLTASAGANNVSLSQIYLKVSYYTVGPDVTNPTVGTHTYHYDNVKYLHDPSDVPVGQRFAVGPEHGWYDALWAQDCYDICHRGNGGQPTFSAVQGDWMWYSVAGDPVDPYVGTRTLTLKTITIPSDAPSLTFNTNYRLTGATGYVEISTDGGGNWAPLTGTVGGVSKSSITGDAAGWVAASYDLSAYAGQSAKLRFRYVAGSSVSEGWAFDSLVLSGAGGPVFSDDAETLKPDWTNQWWTRSNGAFPRQ